MSEKKEKVRSQDEYFNKEWLNLLPGTENPAKSLENLLKSEDNRLPYRTEKQTDDEEFNIADIKSFIYSMDENPEQENAGGLYPLSGYQYISGKKGHFSQYPLFINRKSGECGSLLTYLKEVIVECGDGSEMVDYLSSLLPALIRDIVSKKISEDNFVGELIKYRENVLKKGFEKGKVKSFFDAINKTIEPDLKLILPEEKTPFALLENAIAIQNQKSGDSLTEKVDILLKRLREIRYIDDLNAKNPSEAGNSSNIESLATYINLNNLKQFMPDSSTESLPKETRGELENCISVLSEFNNIRQSHLLIESGIEFTPDIQSISSKPLDVKILLNKAVKTSRKSILDYTDLIRHIGTGKLIADNRYNTNHHTAFFDNLDINSMSDSDRSCLPIVVVLIKASSVNGEFEEKYLQILRSELPIKFLVLEDRPTKTLIENPLSLVNLTLALRNSFVFTNSVLNGIGLFNNYKQGLNNPYNGLFMVRSLQPYSSLLDILKESLEVESRLFPILNYNADFKQEYGRRFDINNNPDSEAYFAGEEVSIKLGNTPKKEIFNITPADVMLMSEGFSDQFMTLNRGISNEHLVLIDQFLELPREEWPAKIPYINGVNEKGEIVSVFCKWRVIEICFRILDQWKYLQESAGINNYHVLKALELQKEEFDKQKELEIQNLREEYEGKMEEARRESEENTIDRIATTLLQGEYVIQESDRQQLKMEPEVEEKEQDTEQEETMGEEVIEKEQPADSGGAESEEPWIETPMCTSCNDCIDINNTMFKYNEENMAYIADPSAGTYLELVQAAEKCPAGIIHPGKPLNKNEKNLENLIKRAEKFN